MRQTWVRVSVLALAVCVSLDKLLSPSQPWTTHQKNDSHACLTELSRALNELIYAKCRKQCLAQSILNGNVFGQKQLTFV